MKLLLRDNFCSSPWFHIKINPVGDYSVCRWDYSSTPSKYNIANTSIQEFVNSDTMRNLRLDLLNGQRPKYCESCYYQDGANKVSGRRKQLLKSGIQILEFDRTFCSSPHFELFKHSYTHNGATEKTPVDLQIDLGNTCNSACIMCVPTYSSRLAKDYIQLKQLEPGVFGSYQIGKNWSDNPELVDKFINDLQNLPEIKYIHFLGGETLYLKSFYDICERLIDLDLAKNISIGTTTNGTVYSEQLEKIIKSFKHVHLGISVESFNQINDYIRWPSTISIVQDNLSKFLALRETTKLHISLRITPSILSILHLDTVFEYMIKNKVIAESCNILQEPECLRIELLPEDLRAQAVDKINAIIKKYSLIKSDETIINLRRDDLVDPVITQTIYEYLDILNLMTAPLDAEAHRQDLVKFLKAFETLRNNNILEYLPEYGKFLRSYGY